MCFPIVKLDAGKLFDDVMYKLCPPRIIRGFGLWFDSGVLISLLTHPFLIWTSVVYYLFNGNFVFLALGVIFNVLFIIWSLWVWRLPKPYTD